MSSSTNTSLSARLKTRGRALGVGIALSASVVFLTLALMTIILIGFPSAGSLPPGYDLFLQILIVVAAEFALVTIYLTHTDYTLDYLDFHIPSTKDLLTVISGIIASFLFLVLFALLLSAFNITPAQHSVSAASPSQSTTTSIALYPLLIPMSLLLIAPAEELVFRNLIQKRLAEAFSPHAAVALASLFFALLHSSAYASGTAIQTGLSIALVFSLAIILGTAYVITDNITVPILIHGVYNAIQFWIALSATQAALLPVL